MSWAVPCVFFKLKQSLCLSAAASTSTLWRDLFTSMRCSYRLRRALPVAVTLVALQFATEALAAALIVVVAAAAVAAIAVVAVAVVLLTALGGDRWCGGRLGTEPSTDPDFAVPAAVNATLSLLPTWSAQ